MPDTTTDTDFRQSLVAAVQAELQRHAANLNGEIDRLRKDAADERAALRRDVQQQIAELMTTVTAAQTASAAELDKAKAALEARVVDSETRQGRRFDDVTSGLSAAVQAAARPILADAAAEQERAGARVDGLEKQLRKFDEQAARMVTYVSEVIQRTEARQAEAAAELDARVAAQVAGLKPLVDEIDSSMRRFQNDMTSQVSTRIGDAEDRLNSRLMASEARMKDAAGEQIAEIQAYVGRVNANIDQTLSVLNNRHEQVDDRFAATDLRIDELAASVEGVDGAAMDEMRDKVSGAVGEAMLVRIEMERLEKSIGERTDQLTVRITDVETQLVDATMDVSTAVQLDRLEELERAVLELDPTRFAAYDPSAAGALRRSDDGAEADTEPTAQLDQPDAEIADADSGGVADDADGAEVAGPDAEPAVNAEVAADFDDPDTGIANCAASADDTEPAAVDAESPDGPAVAAPSLSGPSVNGHHPVSTNGHGHGHGHIADGPRLAVPPPPLGASSAPLLPPALLPTKPKDFLNGSSALAEEVPEPATSSFAPPAG